MGVPKIFSQGPSLTLLMLLAGWLAAPLQAEPIRFLLETQERISIKKKVLVIIYNPVVRSAGWKKLNQVYSWNDPDALAEQYIQDVLEASWNMVHYRVAERIECNEYPLHTDGFRHSDETFADDWQRRNFTRARGDLPRIIKQFNVPQKVESRQIDEVWLFGAPGFSWPESLMAGSGAYFCNSQPASGVNCSRRFVVMGFNYERGVDCMLEDLGHRAEAILRHVFMSWPANALPDAKVGDTEDNPWKLFTRYDQTTPGKAQCGTIHFAPNSTRDYEWGRNYAVQSCCDDWFTYPALPGNRRLVNSSEWGSGDMRLHHLWWFKHLPRASGKIHGKENNWWKYIMNYDQYE
jgi:hypothetical protein